MVSANFGLVKLLLLPLAFISHVNAAVTAEPEEGFLVDRATTLTLDQAVAVKTQNNGRLTKNLTNLVWDDALAADAQKWATYLAGIDKLQHSTSDQRPNQGENLAWALYVPYPIPRDQNEMGNLADHRMTSATNGIKYPMTQGAQAWMAEESNYHNENIPQGDFASYGHYSKRLPRISLLVASN